VCHSGCRDVCEAGDCELRVPLNKEVTVRTLASLIIEVLTAEEVRVCNEPRGRLLWALVEVAKWMGIKVVDACGGGAQSGA